MKKIIFLLCIGITFISCSNDDDGTTTQLNGTWNWIQSSGGITGGTDTPESTGNTMRLEITNSVVKSYKNGDLVSERNYTIESGESLIFGEQRQMIVYEDQFKQTFVVSENTLSLYDECNDCFVSEYERE